MRPAHYTEFTPVFRLQRSGSAGVTRAASLIPCPLTLIHPPRLTVRGQEGPDLQTLFGIDTDVLMLVVLGALVGILVALAVTAAINRVMFKIGVRNLPRRPAQTALIVVGLMLSTLIISAAMGTGDTIYHSIRNTVVESLGEIDEMLFSSEATQGDVRGNPYFPIERYEALAAELDGDPGIDGLAPSIGESVPAVNPVSRQSEGNMRIVAVDPASVGVFGPIYDPEGSPLPLEDLRADEAYLNKKASEELEASVGDSVVIYTQAGEATLKVRGVARDGGLAGDDPTALLTLAAAQRIFDKPGQINTGIVSNRGNPEEGVDLTDEVTERLRGLLTDHAVAGSLVARLADAAVIDALVAAAADVQPESFRDDLLRTADLLRTGETTPELVGLLADERVAAQLLAATERAGGQAAAFETFRLFSRLNSLTVRPIKKELLELADQASSAVSSIFVIFGSFSVVAGIMLIFLIFTMLAAERKPEMGIARAVGMKRRHLVQSFAYEGMAYDLLSALVGTLMGIAVGMIMVAGMAAIFSRDGGGFEIEPSYTMRSFIISYSLGVVLTFITVLFSSYRASRLNIVAAIRDLPEVFQASERESSLRLVLRSVGRPVVFALQAYAYLREGRLGAAALRLALALGWIVVFPVWIADIAWTLGKICAAALMHGWLTFVVGVLLVALGVWTKQAAPFTLGATTAVIGIGLLMRGLFTRRKWSERAQHNLTGAAIAATCLFWLAIGSAQSQPYTVVISLVALGFEAVRQIALRRKAVNVELEDKHAFTFVGVSLTLFWATPFDSLDFIVPELNSSIEMFLISGVCMVAAAVWTVIYNSDLITGALSWALGIFPRIRPAVNTAVAYALYSKIRTGLTLAMLSLVIFTLIVMSSLTSSFDAAFEDVDLVTGGWDISASTSYSNPVEDFNSSLSTSLGERAGDIEAVGAYSSLPIEARQPGADEQEWREYRVQGSDAPYLEQSEYGIQLMSKDYGETGEEIWAALQADPSLAVIDRLAVPSRAGDGNFGQIVADNFTMEGFYAEDDEMPATRIELRDARTGNVATVTVIGVLDSLSDRFRRVITSKSVIDRLAGEPVPFTVYRIKLAEGADAAEISREVEAAYLENGMETTVLADDIAEEREANVAINRLLQGFMATGLLVGIAALGVVSLRAVVERRQQIGVLKAIGYRRSMIMASYLIESSFISLLGILLGIGLGTVLSLNIVDQIAEEVPGLTFTVAWAELGVIVALAYVFSLLTTIVPARQAAGIYPAEALRYA